MSSLKPDRPVLWCRLAAEEAQATKGKTIKERAGRPLQPDIGNINIFWSVTHAGLTIATAKGQHPSSSAQHRLRKLAYHAPRS